MATSVLTHANVSTDAGLVGVTSGLIASKNDSGLYFDFDGVLSNIQRDPDTVQPLPGVLELLTDFVAAFRVVSILSSRPAGFLNERFRSVTGLRVLGLYGLERTRSDGSVWTDERAVQLKQVISGVLTEARREFSGTAVRVEDKRYSVGLHFRDDVSMKGHVEQFVEDVVREKSLKPQPGREAIELKPDLGVDKGSTLKEDSRSLANVWYFGDDLGDLPAFAHVAQRRQGDQASLSRGFGVGNDTVVPEVLEACDFFMESPTVLRGFLENVRLGLVKA